MTQAEKLENAKKLIESCVAKINPEEREAYRAIAQYAVELGYMPKQVLRSGKKSDDLDFKKNKVKRKLMQLRATDGNLKIKMVFCATPDCFEYLQAETEFYEGKNFFGCGGCGRCKGEPQGYTHTYPDGKTVFRCGAELVHMWDLDAVKHLDEIKTMMKTQDELWMAKA